MAFKKGENTFLKVVMILVVSTLLLVALMYIMHLITYEKGETTLWQSTINYVKPKPFLSKTSTSSLVMLEDSYSLVYIEDSSREEEQCSGFYRYERVLDEENADVIFNYLDHFCLDEDLLIELKREEPAFTAGIFSLDKENLFYFSTNQHEITDKANYSINKVYAYNVGTGEFTVVYQELKESLAGEFQFSAYQEYDVVGISGSKLILSKLSTSGLGGDYRCFNVLSSAGENELFTFYYLELSDENMKLQEYSVPAENILRAKRWVEKCNDSLF